MVIPWEVVKSIELSDSWDRWDALPITCSETPASRPVRLSSVSWTHPARLTFNQAQGRGISSPILLQPFAHWSGAFTNRW